jgi:hypothetical protein
MKKTFKTLRDKIDAEKQQAMQQQQQQMEQQGQIAQSQMQQAQQQHEADLAHQDYQNELDRINKKEIALIAAEAKGATLADTNTNQVPDVLEIGRLSHDQQKAAKDYELKLAQIHSQNKQASDKLAIEKEKLQVARENQANDLAVAKENAKGRANKKSK